MASPLHLASENGHIDAVQLLLDHGADTEIEYRMRTPIMKAYIYDHYDTMRLLLRYGADIRRIARDDSLSLHFMIEEDQMDLFMLLLDHVDIDNKDENAVTPLMIAAEFGRNDMIRVLLDRGANIDCVDHTNEDAEYYAVANDHIESAKILIDHRVSLLQKEIDVLVARRDSLITKYN